VRRPVCAKRRRGDPSPQATVKPAGRHDVRMIATPDPDLPRTLADFAAVAQTRLSPDAFGYYSGGAGDELTLSDNVAAWSRIALRPRVLVDVSTRDCGVLLLGRPRPHPLIVAPTAFQKHAHPEGEVATARAAAQAGAIFCLSTIAHTGVAELAAGAPDADRWLQLYVFRDRGVSRDMVAAAADNGFEAIVITVDLPVWGARDRDIRSGFVAADASAVPSADAAAAAGAMTPADFAGLIDPSLTWDDIEAFAAESELPVLVKGVLSAEDARHAADAGAAGVVVSNHGGRQLDTVLSGADALPGVVDAVGGDVDVLVDGGIRRGTDIVKALAYGARAVMVGRPVLWGLATAGTAGAHAVLDILLRELDVALALVGIPNARDLDRSVLQPAPWVDVADRRPFHDPGHDRA
jgi:4-hydroxymandelate oxidase